MNEMYRAASGFLLAARAVRGARCCRAERLLQPRVVACAIGPPDPHDPAVPLERDAPHTALGRDEEHRREDLD